MEENKQYEIVIVGQQPWDVEIGSNCKNIALELSKNHRVLYVNSPLKRSSLIKGLKSEKINKRIAVIKREEDALIKISKNLWNLYPDCIAESVNWLPDNFIFDFFNKLNNKRFADSISRAITNLNFKNFILFNDNDIYDSFYLKELLSPKLYIYYSRDYMIGTGFWKKHGPRLEPLLIAKSDIVMANSVYLTNYCKQYNRRSFYVGQGCEFDLFTDPSTIELPSEIKTIKSPIIGYVGFLSASRLDISIISKIATDNPHWNIVLVGPEDQSFSESILHQFENIHFTGSKPVEELATYIKNFDVCINPQVLNDLTIGNYPRKIDEYLAMGKPVVATKTEAMDIFSDYVLLANDKYEYQKLIEEALNTDSKEKQQSRIEFALSHTWENSVNEMRKAIRETFSNKHTDKKKLKNMPVFILGLNRFDSDIESTSFNIAKEFSNENDVYYIDNPFTVRDFINLKGTKAYDTRKEYFFRNSNRIIKKDGTDINIIIPPLGLSLNFFPEGIVYRKILQLKEMIISNCIKKIIKERNIEKFIFINAFNFHYPNIGKIIKPFLYIYHCVDPLIVDYDRKHGLVSENQIIREADLVICTSKQLYKEKKKINPNTYFIPNAADVEHFNKALEIENINTQNRLLRNIKRPIIGYIGNIERRIDYQLVINIAKKHPDKNFVFIGPVEKEFIPEAFLSVPNIYLPGKANYEDLPEILSQFDIAMIPFKKDEVSNTIFPLKLFEYLGAGRPVISTNFNQDLEEFTKESVVYCSDAASFSNAIDFILENDNEEKKQYRLKIATENTWNQRFIQLESFILEKIKSNSAS